MLCGMKKAKPSPNLALLVPILGLAVSLTAQTAPAPNLAAPPAARGSAAPAPVAPKPKETPKPSAPESAPKIEGTPLARQNGGWLGLAVEGGHFVLRFYDKDKKPAKADAPRATARWQPANKPGDQRAVLNPSGDGTALTAPQAVTPPLTFKVYLTLLDAEGNAAESFVADLRAP
jgi:hypothetical protein